MLVRLILFPRGIPVYECDKQELAVGEGVNAGYCVYFGRRFVLIPCCYDFFLNLEATDSIFNRLWESSDPTLLKSHWRPKSMHLASKPVT